MAMRLQGATARPFAAEGVVRSGRLFLLEMSGDRIHSINPDGSDRKTIVTGCHLPGGIVVDAEAGHVYWTNTGVPNLDDGSIERARRTACYRHQRPATDHCRNAALASRECSRTFQSPVHFEIRVVVHEEFDQIAAIYPCHAER
jgi:hypothetical protein